MKRADLRIVRRGWEEPADYNEVHMAGQERHIQVGQGIQAEYAEDMRVEPVGQSAYWTSAALA